MKVGDKIAEWLDRATECVENVSAEMANKENNNAYRFLSTDNPEGLRVPLLLYQNLLATPSLPLGNKQQEIIRAVEELGDAWDGLFDAVGQRIKEAHADLEDVRNCCAEANELLQSHLGSDDIGVAPDKTAKGAIRRFEAAIGSLSVAMREELVGEEPTISGTEQKDNIRFLALSLIKGLVHHFNWSQAEAVSAVHARLWQEFKKVGLKCGEENFRQLQYKGKVTDAPYADIEKLREYNLIK